MVGQLPLGAPLPQDVARDLGYPGARVEPHWYIGDFSLTAGEQRREHIWLRGGEDYFCFDVAHSVSSGAFRCALRTGEGNAPISTAGTVGGLNDRVRNECLFGSVTKPARLPKPLLVPGSAAIIMDLEDVSGAPNTLHLVFPGVQIFLPPGAVRVAMPADQGGFYGSPYGTALPALPPFEYGRRSLLETWLPFLLLESGYVWRGHVVPGASKAVVPALGQLEERITIPSGSFLLGFAAGSQQPEGFRFELHDIGTGEPALCDRADENRSGAQDQTDEDPLPHILPVPYAIVPPGQLVVRIANLAAAPNDLQLLLHFAVPAEAMT